MKKNNLNQLLYRFDELQKVIINSSITVHHLDEDLKRAFLKQLLPIMDEFELIIDQLKIELEVYFKEEKENKEPTNFTLRKLYKDLETLNE